MYEIASKLAVITGGTRGIGLGIARHLLEAGGKVVINGRVETEEAGALQAEYGKDRIAIDLGDVSVPAEATGLVGRAAKQFGRLDILVHAAGGPAPGKIVDLTPEAWANAFAIHVHPVFHLFRAAQVKLFLHVPHPFRLAEKTLRPDANQRIMRV